MGGLWSQPPPSTANHSSSSGNDDDCSVECPPPPPCFSLLSSLLPRKIGSGVHNNAVDNAIGSPLPDTPLMERRRREDVKNAVRRDQNPLFSSRYGGLEKEPSTAMMTMFTLDNGPPIQQQQNGGGARNGNSATTATTTTTNGLPIIEEATVYEGEDCEQRLYDKYEICEVLGVGSTSTVHRCVDKHSGMEYSCKIIDCQLIEEKFCGMMTQFQTEITSLRKLHHPGIIQLYDVYIKPNDKIYIIMELMNGGELFDYVVEKGTLTEEEASRIVRKVADALCYLHNQNIVHRDLKPENLLLKHKPQPTSGGEKSDPVDVKIIDFGLSKAMEERNTAYTFLGTRGYLAPEMLQRREYTRAVDAWALGVIVFVLLCGCLPFDDDSSSVPSDDLIPTRFTLRFPRWAKNLSLSAKDLLHHLLDVNPQTRYTAENVLEHPWVRGETAPKGNLLASPGRIKKSPAPIVLNNTTGATAGRYTKAGRKYAPDPTQTPPAPMIRKGSI